MRSISHDSFIELSSTVAVILLRIIYSNKIMMLLSTSDKWSIKVRLKVYEITVENIRDYGRRSGDRHLVSIISK